MDGHAGSPLGLSRTLPVGGGLLVPYSLSGCPVIKQLMQMVTMVPGQGGRLQSVCLPSQARRPEGSTESRGPAAPAGEVGALGACGFRTASPRGACLWKTGLKEVLERVRRTRAGGWAGAGERAWVCKGVAGFQYISHTDSARGLFSEKVRQILLKSMSVTCWQGPAENQGAAGVGEGGGGEEGPSGRREEPERVRQRHRAPLGRPSACPLEQSAGGSTGSPLAGGWRRVLETRPPSTLGPPGGSVVGPRPVWGQGGLLGNLAP